MLQGYTFHPEFDWRGPDGQPPTRYTRGVQQRRPVMEMERRIIGKESDYLDRDADSLESMFASPPPVEFRSMTRPEFQAMHRHTIDLAVQISGGVTNAARRLGIDKREFSRWDKQAQQQSLSASVIYKRQGQFKPLYKPILLVLIVHTIVSRGKQLLSKLRSRR